MSEKTTKVINRTQNRVIVKKVEEKTSINLESILTEHIDGKTYNYKYRQFLSAVSASKSLPQRASEIRCVICQIGQALYNLYTTGLAKKIKKNDLTALVETYFPESIVSRFDRSHYQAFYLDYYDLESFCQAFGINSTTIPYIRSKYKEHVATVKAKTKADKIATGGNQDTDKTDSKITNRVIGKAPEKTGLDAEDPIKIVSTEEFMVQFNIIHNGAIRRFNSNEFNADQLNELERIATNFLFHINSSDGMDKAFKASEKKTKAA